MSLVIPPPNRSRASSTNIRPALTINTLGRRRSSSPILPCQQSEPSTPSTPQSRFEPAQILASPEPAQRPSMFTVIASGFLDLLHVPTRHSINWSTPSSPQSVVQDELLLPISASSQKTTFGDVYNEKDTLRLHAWRWRAPSVRVAPVLTLTDLTFSIPAPRPYIAGDAALPANNGGGAGVIIFLTHFRGFPYNASRACGIRSRDACIFTKWSATISTRHRCIVCYCSLETCVVYPW